MNNKDKLTGKVSILVEDENENTIGVLAKGPDAPERLQKMFNDEFAREPNDVVEIEDFQDATDCLLTVRVRVKPEHSREHREVFRLYTTFVY